MTNKKGPDHVVVDGSNIATEGRSLPSLAQLQDAVMAFMAEYPGTAVTVVVDATFGHRIDKSEVKNFDEGIANNELVAPPAGAVGRGDAFVLGIADKADATVLSNDSFQEFHGEYDWLFDEGRLIGGKPVPHVGWVFVDRVPVRGPVSRQATGSRGGSKRGSRSKSRKAGKASKAASEPMPVPKSPPPGGKGGSSKSEQRTDAEKPESGDGKAPAKGARGDGAEKRPAPKRGEPVNDVLPFLQFVEHHPLGTSVNGTVDAYSSHGAYISIGDDGVRGYIPLSLMADPPPRSARKQLKIGESVTVVVVSFMPERRSIDCAMPDMVDAALSELDTEDAAEVEAEVKEAVEASADPAELQAASAGDDGTSPASERQTKKRAAKKRAGKKSAAKKAAAKKSPAKKVAAKKTPAKKSAAKKSAAKKSPAKKAAAKKAPAKQGAAKKSAAKKAPAKKAAAKKSAAKKAATKKAATKKAGSRKKTASRKAATERSTSTDAGADPVDAPGQGDQPAERSDR